MDDKDDRQHFSLKGILENEKPRKKKRKRKLKESQAMEDNFNVNLEDSRFDALFTSHHFAVDPSDPQYRYSRLTFSLKCSYFSVITRRENIVLNLLKFDCCILITDLVFTWRICVVWS